MSNNTFAYIRFHISLAKLIYFGFIFLFILIFCCKFAFVLFSFHFYFYYFIRYDIYANNSLSIPNAGRWRRRDIMLNQHFFFCLSQCSLLIKININIFNMNLEWICCAAFWRWKWNFFSNQNALEFPFSCTAHPFEKPRQHCIYI